MSYMCPCCWTEFESRHMKGRHMEEDHGYETLYCIGYGPDKNAHLGANRD